MLIYGQISMMICVMIEVAGQLNQVHPMANNRTRIPDAVARMSIEGVMSPSNQWTSADERYQSISRKNTPVE